MVGINNLLGFRTGVAAVKIPDFPLSPDSPYRTASTPDDDYLNHDNESLLWYALLPTTAVGDAVRFEVDTARNRLVLPNALGESSFEIDFQGFLQPSEIPDHRRQEIRRQVYADNRRSRELRSVGRHESSKAVLREAMRQARTIYEQELVHWLETEWGRGLVEAGEPEGAQDWFEKTFDALNHDLARGYELAFQGRISGPPRILSEPLIASVAHGFGAIANVLAVGDVDNDGDPDILVGGDGTIFVRNQTNAPPVALCPCMESNALFADFILGNLDILTVIECRDNAVIAGLQYVLTDGSTVAAGSGTWTNHPLCGTNDPSENEWLFFDITPEEDEACRELLRQACPTP